MTDELVRQWGLNIRLARQVHDKREGIPAEKGMVAMATALEVTTATISRWETGKAIPTDDHKLEIAEYLDVDVRTLFPLVRRSA